jgi:hypothetical protein
VENNFEVVTLICCLHRYNINDIYIQGVPGGEVNILGGHSIGYSKQCPIPNGFRDTAISLYSSKTVDKKDILCTVSNTDIYCSSDKVGTAYLVQYIFENSTVNINALCNSCKDSIFGICEDVRNFSQESDNVSIHSHNGQLTLHTDSHAEAKDSIGHQVLTTFFFIKICSGIQKLIGGVTQAQTAT